MRILSDHRESKDSSPLVFRLLSFPVSPLCSYSSALFSATAVSQPFAYQSLPHSFHHHGGYTPSRYILDLVTQRSHSCSFISNTYKLQFFYLLSFDIHANCRGCRGSEVPSSRPTSNLQLLTSAFSYSPALFCTFFHFLALSQNSTLFFSSNSELFRKNTRGMGRCYPRALRASRSGVGPTSFEPKTLLSFRPASPLCSASLRVHCVSALSFSPKTGQCHLRHMVRDIYCSGRRLRTV
jgi:hypothetical protein